LAAVARRAPITLATADRDQILFLAQLPLLAAGKVHIFQPSAVMAGLVAGAVDALLPLAVLEIPRQPPQAKAITAVQALLTAAAAAAARGLQALLQS